jgi:hypothetical protein
MPMTSRWEKSHHAQTASDQPVPRKPLSLEEVVRLALTSAWQDDLAVVTYVQSQCDARHDEIAFALRGMVRSGYAERRQGMTGKQWRRKQQQDVAA